MGICSHEKYEVLTNQAPIFEGMLVESRAAKLTFGGGR